MELFLKKTNSLVNMNKFPLICKFVFIYKKKISKKKLSFSEKYDVFGYIFGYFSGVIRTQPNI